MAGSYSPPRYHHYHYHHYPTAFHPSTRPPGQALIKALREKEKRREALADRRSQLSQSRMKMIAALAAEDKTMTTAGGPKRAKKKKDEGGCDGWWDGMDDAHWPADRCH